ncbi:murein transglycosylase A [Aestuariivirga sp.]|uniref:murein transglycosylase A n=1 Tax=Aestuariivirga sp. TaxID=2650926 RepID=UPI003593D23D
MSTESEPTLEPVSFQDLAGWSIDNHDAALDAFRLSCREILDTGAGFARPVRFAGTREAWKILCQEAFEARDARRFFEARFQPFRVIDQSRPAGLFTGYFEPEAAGARERSETYRVPIYRKPADLVSFSEEEQRESGLAYGRRVDGKPQPYFSRKEIEQGRLDAQGLELVWLRDWADAFFIHVQGSGRVRLEDGSIIRLSYSAKSGLPYTGIGALLVERGVIRREDMSMQALRAWMVDNPAAARELMWENRSFIFFREVELENQELGALGAQHVQLTPMRSLAIDRSQWAFGTPVWLDTSVPEGDGTILRNFRHLLIAQDTGSAITGLARGDVFWGFGEKAAVSAGHMKSPGTMTVLLPTSVAKDLGLLP